MNWPMLWGPKEIPRVSRNTGTVVIVGGGVGIAPIHPIAKALKKAEIEVLQSYELEQKTILKINMKKLLQNY